MNGFPKLAGGAALAISLGAGAFALAGPARADSWQDDCFGASGCVRIHCDDDGHCTRPMRPSRYACDADGADCHWTRSYRFDEEGNAVYDPGLGPEQ
jgi:hypothetical protein